jgi:hypothetical protein
MLGKFSDAVLTPGSEKNSLGVGSSSWQVSIFVTDIIPTASTGYNYTTVGLQDWIDEWIPYWSDQALFIRPILFGDSGSPRLAVLNSNSVGFTKISSGIQASDINAGIVAIDAAAGISTGYVVTVAADPTL